MIPVTFGGCFGWLHEGRERTGVVLCGSFGQEGMFAYHGWSALAEDLAASGLHALRFDYPGTGDSLGAEDDPERLDSWIGGIRDATEFLRAASGVQRVILVGLRLGGALALRASVGMEEVVVAAACLVPVVSGRTYVRELRLMTNAWRDANLLPATPAADGGMEVVGDRLTDATVRDLSRLDLRSLRTAPPHVLLMEDDAYPGTSDLASHLTGLGAEVSLLPFAGASAFLQAPLARSVPERSFKQLVRWCLRFQARASGSDTAGAVAAISRPRLSLPSGASETPFRFGPSNNLFGILCRPSAHRPDAPTAIMVNTGFGHRVGDGRVYVTLARQLAAGGVSSLRMDLEGTGDSRSRDGRPYDPYSATRVADIVAAIGALEKGGFDKPVLVGICSGAHAAFHAAVADRRVTALLAVNLQKFIWKEGASLEVENRRARRPLGFYVKAAGARKAWRRLLKGDVEIVSIIRSLLAHGLGTAGREVCLWFEATTGIETGAGRIVRDFTNLSLRCIRVDLVYSEDDPGLAELARHFGPDLRRLRSLSNVRTTILGGADHALLDGTARAHFICMVVDRLCGDIRHDLPPPVPARADQRHSEPLSAA